MRSLRFRILALVLGIVTMVALATVTAVVVKANAEVGRQAELQLESAALTAREVLKFRGNQLSSAVEVLTSDFGFKEAVASNDTPTLASAVANYRGRIGADVLIVLDAEGRSLASTLDALSPALRADLHSLVAEDADQQTLRLYRLIDGRPYQLVLSPVLAPDLIAWAAMGFALDEKVAGDMSRLLGVEVSFVATEDAVPPFVAGALAARPRIDLHSLLGPPAGAAFSMLAGNDELLTWTNPIRAANGGLTLVLQRSLDDARRPYLQLRESILLIGLAILTVASLLGALLARSATQPVDDLIRAAERLEAGDYRSAVPLANTTEISRLSSAFNAMRAAVAERERIIRHQAAHDPLTGLLTRARMSELLETLLAPTRQAQRTLTICIVEILQFQNIVGSLGHAAADEILREVARRLSFDEELRDRVARIGTDQFLVVSQGPPGRSAAAVGDAVADKLKAPLDFAGISLQLETRMGISVFPNDAERAADLLQCAELALYRAKDSGLSVGAFVRGDDEIHRHRLEILGDLRRAIAANELELHYQPKVALPSGAVVGCEALVRWRHPLKGPIAPSEFIAHAERTGLIRQLTGWVLGAALRQIKAWQQSGLELDVSVNVSPADLADPNFADSVIALLEQTGADATRVVLEVTESGAMKDLANTIRIMEGLRVLGIRFSIDDFGTGYSSLAHVRRLPVDEIKIDRSFVQDLEKQIDDDVILRSTIRLGHALNLKVVAEGVEVAASWDALTRFGCDLVQGYFVSKPLPASDFAAWTLRRAAAPERGAARAPASPPIASISDRRSSSG